MNRLVERSLGPPGGWKYTQPESGVPFQGTSYSQLLEKVRQHRRGNGYDISPGWELRFDDEFCVQNALLGTIWCPIEGEVTKVARGFGVADVRRFLHSVEAVIKTGNEAFVDPEEAERRAAICASCPLNATQVGCFGCSGLTDLIKRLRGPRTTSQDSKLRHCAVCGCVNSVKVWLKKDAVDSTGLAFPDHCWISETQEHEESAPAL